MSYELKYIKYKNKYLELKRDHLVGGNKRIEREIKEITDSKEYSNVVSTKSEDEENKGSINIKLLLQGLKIMHLLLQNYHIIIL